MDECAAGENESLVQENEMLTDLCFRIAYSPHREDVSCGFVVTNETSS